MGCYNISCAVSGKTITDSDEVYQILLQPTNNILQHSAGTIFSDNLTQLYYAPILFPVRGIYSEDNQWIPNLVDDDYLKLNCIITNKLSKEFINDWINLLPGINCCYVLKTYVDRLNELRSWFAGLDFEESSPRNWVADHCKLLCCEDNSNKVDKLMINSMLPYKYFSKLDLFEYDYDLFTSKLVLQWLLNYQLLEWSMLILNRFWFPSFYRGQADWNCQQTYLLED